jgi:hypothetical protein
MQTWYIKTDYMKHIFWNCFTHKLQEHEEINILQTKSYDNLMDLFTESLPFAIFDKCVKGIGIRRLKDL